MVQDKAFARSKDALGAVYTYPSNPTDEAIDCYIAPLVSSPRRKQLMNQYAIGLERNALAGIEPALRALRTPVRIVWGTGDDIFAATNPAYLDRIVGNSRGVRRVPGRQAVLPRGIPGPDRRRSTCAVGCRLVASGVLSAADRRPSGRARLRAELDVGEVHRRTFAAAMGIRIVACSTCRNGDGRVARAALRFANHARESCHAVSRISNRCCVAVLPGERVRHHGCEAERRR